MSAMRMIVYAVLVEVGVLSCLLLGHKKAMADQPGSPAGKLSVVYDQHCVATAAILSPAGSGGIYQKWDLSGQSPPAGQLTISGGVMTSYQPPVLKVTQRSCNQAHLHFM